MIVPPTEGPGALDLLDVEAVVSAAIGSAADAIHPGFGFLAENAALAEAVAAGDMIWVGPPPSAIRAMGDKAAARRLATSLDVPVIPGYDGTAQDDETLVAEAARIGWPVLVKPAAGGGGKGMHTVRVAERLPGALAAARREARSAFGDDRLILERLVEGPRHVEIQVLFDAHGNGVHLGERDCSLQRRHQKILEESPSPGVDQHLRERLGTYALALAGAVGYVGAGTCEFLVDDRGGIWFLEMNTRLQVEHPVTEAVTGRDLVADQLRIAEGAALGVHQGEIGARGHAAEVRVYAEDADDGFLPATGRIERLGWPSGPGIRVDAGVELGTEITSRFDPMLAKIIAHGKDRAEAFDRLASALDATVILGVTTNLRFLRWVVNEPALRAGQARIDTLERIWPPDDLSERTRVPDTAWAIAGRELGTAPLDVGSAAARATGSAPQVTSGGDVWSGGWRLGGRARAAVEGEDEIRVVRLEATDVDRTDQPAWVRVGDTVHVDVGGRSLPFRLTLPPDVDRAARAAAAHAGGGGTGEVVAPMPGAVVALHVAVGDTLEAGQPIATLEAMKMEHLIVAPGSGTLIALDVQAGEQVVRGQVLASFASAPPSAAESLSPPTLSPPTLSPPT